MQLEAQSLFSGVANQTFPEFKVTGVLCVDACIDFDAAVVVAVPLFGNFYKFLTLFIGIEVKILVLIDEAVGTQCRFALMPLSATASAVALG